MVQLIARTIRWHVVVSCARERDIEAGYQFPEVFMIKENYYENHVVLLKITQDLFYQVSRELHAWAFLMNYVRKFEQICSSRTSTVSVQWNVIRRIIIESAVFYHEQICYIFQTPGVTPWLYYGVNTIFWYVGTVKTRL